MVISQAPFNGDEICAPDGRAKRILVKNGWCAAGAWRIAPAEHFLIGMHATWKQA
jgi:hypothetical protein